MRTTINNNAFTLVEIMVAVACSVLLLTGVYGFYTVSSQAYSSGISGQILQDGANIVLSKIIEGDTESNVIYRLSTAVSYLIPNTTGSKLYYCQDTPCTATDSTARSYYLNTTGTAVMYHYPGETTDKAIYTAPTGTVLTLRFSPATTNTSLAVEIDVDLTGKTSNSPLTTSGDVSTFVLLRNHSYG